MKKILAALLVSSTAVLLTACAASSNGEVSNGAVGFSEEGTVNAGAPVAPDAYADSTAVTEEARVGAGSALVTGEVTDRQVIRIGNMSVVVENVETAAKEVKNLTKMYGGYVSSEDSSGDRDTNDAYATVTSQIPSGKLDEYMVKVGELGEVTSTTVSAQDVTAVVVDLDARITALSSSITRLNELMTKAGSVEELLSVESAISQRQTELDALVAQREALGEQVAMSAITVFFSASPVFVPAETEGFTGGLKKGWADFQTSVGNFMTSLGEATPVLLLIVFPLLLIVFFIVFLLIRGARKRSRKHAGEAGTSLVP